MSSRWRADHQAQQNTDKDANPGVLAADDIPEEYQLGYEKDDGTGVVTLEDYSPYIVYGGETWRIDHREDGLAYRYRGGTFHASVQASSWAQVRWAGTDIAVYGAKRPNHGFYAVVVDNGPIMYFDGFASPGDIQTALYESKGLDQGAHELLIVNQNTYNSSHPEKIWFDLDFIKFTGAPIDPKGVASTAVVWPPVSTIVPSPSSDAADPSPTELSISSTTSTTSGTSSTAVEAETPSVVMLTVTEDAPDYTSLTDSQWVPSSSGDTAGETGLPNAQIGGSAPQMTLPGTMTGVIGLIWLGMGFIRVAFR